MIVRIALGLSVIGAASRALALAPIYDPVALNIGINCHWLRSCQLKQRNAMSDSRRFMAREHPATWRIHLCNKNARRGPARIDWIGFNNCIRNSHLSSSSAHFR
jgi:hypothetical protein